ncbi:hypothetical protein PtA15_10A185 [Puccinia triticina]|uniref:Uncharacterized protein n=1 Tax=Puccinia triticina TaxID=208348 RepID=A0ABY7CXC2_9BASI|nr:uncharacterized protein PtA15_10A185 [Puccinia triticina]WAQ88766.1 hypothetical protein PtA15_10A185 [Puccinia triticina]
MKKRPADDLKPNQPDNQPFPTSQSTQEPEGSQTLRKSWVWKYFVDKVDSDKYKINE